jgi:uncharacterized protein (DUF2141 family)
MRKLLPTLFVFLFLVGCGRSEPLYTDNGHSGQIEVIVFYDANRNGTMDQGESGLQEQVGISQDISCPASGMKKVTEVETDSKGEVVFAGLKPGRYCVGYFGSKGLTTTISPEVYVSSDLVTQVFFGSTEK